MLILVALSPWLLDLYKDYSYLKGSYLEGRENLTSGRIALFLSSLNVYLQNPIFGVGQGMIQGDEYVGAQSHNTYMEMLAENGVVAFGLFMGLLWSLFRHIRSMYRSIHSVEMHYTLISLVGGMIALLIAAIPTSAITMTLFWIQITVILAMSRIVTCGSQVLLRAP